MRFPTLVDARAFVGTEKLSSLTPLALAIFALFSIMGFLSDVMTGGRQPAGLLAANVLFSGTIAIGYAFTGLIAAGYRPGRAESVRTASSGRLRGWGVSAVPVVVGFHILYATNISRFFDERVDLSPQDVLWRLRLDGFGIAVCMAVSYTLFLRFIGGTGRKLMDARSELRLAAEIHAVLVPAVARRIGQFEFYGISRASGDVGGDLVDVVATSAPDTGGSPRWIGYVADVSGHGVSSGLMMGMTKSAAHMKLRADTALGPLLDDLNAVLYPLKRPAMYLTFAGVADGGGKELEFVVAGHLPILKITSNGEPVEITTPQVPLGFFSDTRFTSARLTCGPGELLALITDGLTEVFDGKEREFGLEQVKEYLRAHAQLPLETIASGLVNLIQAHGPQLDDQTLLLIRRAAVSPRA
jgi:hypothetical protein